MREERDPKELSRDTWDEMAAGWERHRDFMWETTGHVGEWLAGHVDARPGDVILDLAGGPGDNGFLVSDTVGPDGKVIVTDLAPQMVELAARRAAAAGLTNVETMVLDGEDMTFEDDSIDGIICRWGYMLMQDPLAAVKESRRVLRPGRTLALSVWAGMQENPWVAVVGMTLMQQDIGPPADPHGPGGIFSLGDPGTLEKLLKDGGFEDVAIESMPVVWKHESIDAAWRFMSEVTGPIASAIKQLPPDGVDSLRSALETNLSSFKTGEGLELPGLTLNAVAR